MVLHRLAPGRYKVFVAAAEPGHYVNVESLRLAGRDVLKDGFESPVTGNEPLEIGVVCGR